MLKITPLLALLGVPAVAQVVCDPLPDQLIYTHDPWNASFYYGNTTGNTLNLYFDLEVKGSSIILNELGIVMYDDGTGNPANPNQIGNVGLVNIYTIPGSRVGAETSMTGWTHIGVGEMTIFAYQNDHSPVVNIVDPVTSAPVVVPNGTFGVCLELVPTNAVGTPPQTGPNAGNVGPVHTLGLSPNPALVWEDQFVKIENDGIQNSGWQTTGVGVGPFPLTANATPTGVADSINICIDYSPDPADAGSVSYGDGCYARYRTGYESFPPSANGPDLIDPSTAIGAGGGMTWLYNVDNYLVIPTAPAYVTPTSASITAGAFQASSSVPASWNDAISAPFAFPSSWPGGGFRHPAGVATQFCVASNGHVYLGDVNNNSPLVCGPPNGFLVGATDYEPSIRPYNCSLDPTLGGGIHVDFDPAGAWVRVSWDQLQEPGNPASINTFSVTMRDSGDVEIAYVSLGNVGAGNNALVGYFEGNMAPISQPLDWSVLAISSLPETGNGDAPPVLSLDGRPQLGTSVNFVTSDITPGTLGGIFLVGLNATSPVSLASFGAPGCFGHVDTTNGFVGGNFLGLNANNEISVQLTVPNNPTFLSTNFHAQTLTLLPGINSLGAQSTNGLCANVGN